MPNIDVATLVQQAVRLGLATPAQIEECREEVGRGVTDPQPLVRALERKAYLTPWQSQRLLKGEQSGYFLGGYRLLYRIAAGSFGRVFRADDPQTGTVVAIKVLRKRWSENAKNVELFEREGKVGLALRHPNIVSILAMNKDGPSGQHYIVMEFVEGTTLKDILAIRKKMEPAEALRLLEDAVAGLAYAFSRGVAHRDIKPTNILVSSQGTAKLVDFGLATLEQRQASGQEEDDRVDRTVDYAGLEKATNVKPGDTRSDIYFLGCVFYEMLTGRSPLVMTKDKAVRMQASRFTNVPPIKPDEVKAPASVLRVVETMMSLTPQLRYQTPAQLLEGVRAARREAEGQGQGPGGAPAVRTVFVVEKNVRLQDAFRDKFKKLGYRVLMAGEPTMALNRFQQQPFDAIVMDLATAGEEGLPVFHQILAEAQRQDLACSGIVLLAEEQADLGGRIEPHPRVSVLIRPLTIKDVYEKLTELVPLG